MPVLEPRDSDGSTDGSTLEGQMKKLIGTAGEGGAQTAVAEKPSAAQTPLPGDDGLFWVKHRFLGTRNRIREVAIVGDDDKREWRRVRTWCERHEFRCVGFTPEHRCPAQQAGVYNDLVWLTSEDAGPEPGSPEYERWHIGQVMTVEFEIETARMDELEVPVRGEKVTTGRLRALEHQWRGAPTPSV